jgi:adenylate cyclase class IV
MLRNVEIKAKVRNLDDIVNRAKKLSNSEGTWIKQDDVFFRVPRGRLKLRTFEVSYRNTFQVCNFLLSAGVMFLENVNCGQNNFRLSHI